MASNIPLLEENPLAERESMTMSAFKLWSTASLKSFLTVRNKSILGSFEDLAARAFIAWEEDALVDSSKEHNLRCNLEDYKAKLIIGDNVIPDPFTLKSGWLNEDEGEFPSLYFSDIAEYLKEKNPSDLYMKLCNEYKQGKGYRYFTSGHVKQIFTNHVGESIPVVLLSARVNASMKTQPPYQVWLAVEKNQKDIPGGHIYSAYCTCPVGLHGSCNHIAGVLFKIEHVIRTGKASCTSKPCGWKIPANTRVVGRATKVRDMYWRKDQYFNQDSTVKHQSSVKRLANEFSSLSKEGERYTSNSDIVLDDLATILREEAPNCVFVQLKDRKKNQNKEIRKAPPTLIELAKEIDISTTTMEQQIESLLNVMTLSEQQLKHIAELSSAQSESQAWCSYRNGRITASKMKNVCTRVETLQKKPQENVSNLISNVMGYTSSPQTVAMKHSISLEPHGKRYYSGLMKRTHKHFSTQNTGLIIHPERQYIAASPDLLISCSCCGSGVCEIKCPFSCRNKKPSPSNWAHLVMTEKGTCELSRNSPYYYQVQGQMGCAGQKYADFFVYTPHGHYLERIVFDSKLWEEMMLKFEFFWSNFLAQELLTGSLFAKPSASNEDHHYHKTMASPDKKLVLSVKGHRKGALTVSKLPTVYLCAACKADCISSPSLFSEESIECSNCCSWFHCKCINMHRNDIPHSSSEWKCDACCK